MHTIIYYQSNKLINSSALCLINIFHHILLNMQVNLFCVKILLHLNFCRVCWCSLMRGICSALRRTLSSKTFCVGCTWAVSWLRISGQDVAQEVVLILATFYYFQQFLIFHLHSTISKNSHLECSQCNKFYYAIRNIYKMRWIYVHSFQLFFSYLSSPVRLASADKICSLKCNNLRD